MPFEFRHLYKERSFTKRNSSASSMRSVYEEAAYHLSNILMRIMLGSARLRVSKRYLTIVSPALAIKGTSS